MIFATPSDSGHFAQLEKAWTTTGNLITNGEASGAARFAHGACQRKPGLPWIAHPFILGRCCGQTCIAATATLRIPLSEPSTRFSLVAHTLPTSWCRSWEIKI